MIEERQVPRRDGNGTEPARFECYWELKITCVMGHQVMEERIRAEKRDELVSPEAVQVDSVWYVRYTVEEGEYIEFMRNTIVKRSLLWMEERLPDEPRPQVGRESGWDDASEEGVKA